MNAALGLFDIARREVEAAQVHNLTIEPAAGEVNVSWNPAPGAIATRLYGSMRPVRDIYDLRAAVLLVETEGNQTLVPPYPYYAATAVFDDLENVALVPGENTRRGPQAPRRITGRR